jgi:hypothetical protein
LTRSIRQQAKKFKVYVRSDSMDSAVKRGPGVVKELGFTVPAAVLKPTAIYQGDHDEGEPTWLCYFSRPSRAYDYKTGAERQPWPGKLFVVKFDEYRILRWSGWVKAGAENPNLPENHQSGFDTRLL